MENLKKERIIKTLIEAIIILITLFMINCVLEKLIFKREDWLVKSIISSAGWTLGVMLSKFFNSLNMKFKDLIFGELGLIFLFIFIIAFITGVIMDMAKWYDIVLLLSTTFAASLFIFTDWRKIIDQ